MFNGTIYWLLDSRFDFLLDSFMRYFGVKKDDIILVNSYHNRARKTWNKIYIPYEAKNVVILMEPDEINRVFSKIIRLDKPSLILSFSGVGLPQSDNLVSLIATGAVADRCNDKWWQYCCFERNQILTPDTYQYCSIETLHAELDFLFHQYGKIVIKRPCLSGGYQMAVLSSKRDFENYSAGLKYRDVNQNFLVSEYIPHQQSFASMGIVRKDGSVLVINAVTEQVLYKEVAYEGLIFPAFLDDNHKSEIDRMTEKVGRLLGKNGYFGFYNVDFIMGKDSRMYAVEVNARIGFGTILAACLYGNEFWKLLQGNCQERVKYPKKRLVLGKIKAEEGRVYSNLESYSNILNWFKEQSGFFRTFYCGSDEPERFEYGSFIGMFGEFFDETDTRENILNMFWGRCIKYYKKGMVESEK